MRRSYSGELVLNQAARPWPNHFQTACVAPERKKCVFKKKKKGNPYWSVFGAQTTESCTGVWRMKGVSDAARLPLWFSWLCFPCSPISQQLPAPPQPVSILGQNSANLPWRGAQPPTHPAATFALVRASWARHSSAGSFHGCCKRQKGSAVDVTRRASVGFVGLHSGVFTSCQVLRIIQGQRSSPQLHAELIFFPNRSYFSYWCWFKFSLVHAALLEGKKKWLIFNQEVLMISNEQAFLLWFWATATRGNSVQNFMSSFNRFEY